MILPGDPTDLDALHLRSEFIEMPGLMLNGSQVARLLGLRMQHAIDILDALEKEGFLIRTNNGSYCLAPSAQRCEDGPSTFSADVFNTQQHHQEG